MGGVPVWGDEDGIPPKFWYVNPYENIEPGKPLTRFNTPEAFRTHLQKKWDDYFDACRSGYRPGVHGVGPCIKAFITQGDSSRNTINGRPSHVTFDGHGYAEYRNHEGAVTSTTPLPHIGLNSINLQFSCPEKYTGRLVSGPAGGGPGDYIHECIPTYGAALSHLNIPPKLCAGNPIDITTGLKLQQETLDIAPANTPFNFTYLSENATHPAGWQHQYQRRFTYVEPDNTQKIRAKSGTSYLTKADACLNGWSEIKNKLNSPALNAAKAFYQCGICEIKLGEQRIAELAIIQKDTPFAEVPADKQVALRLERENNTSIIFNHINSCGKDEWRPVGTTTDYRLIALSDGQFQLQMPNGTQETYNKDGQLITVKQGANTQQLSYNTANQLNQITFNNRQTMQFEYTNNQVSAITQGTQTTQFTYTPNGLLQTLTHPNGTSRQYHYEDARFPTALTGITDERGIRYATWQYDAQGRAISSEHAGGAEKTLLAFNPDGSTTVTNPLGKKTTYFFENVLGIKRVKKVTGEPTASCLGANQDYTYNSQGYLETKTDWKGIQTRFEYDAYGRETSRTEAYNTPQARTISTQWHPTLNLKARITEPGKVTDYTYSPQGLLLQTTTRAQP